jgi:hypothetical protein
MFLVVLQERLDLGHALNRETLELREAESLPMISKIRQGSRQIFQ